MKNIDFSQYLQGPNSTWMEWQKYIIVQVNPNIPIMVHPPHRDPAKFGRVLLYSPYLFGKELFPMQDKLISNKQTHFQKQNFSDRLTQ